MTPYGAVPPTGRKIDIRFCDIFQFDGGKLVSLHNYFDVAGMLDQLGQLSGMMPGMKTGESRKVA